MNEDAIFILNDGVEVGVSSESIDYFLQKNPDAVLKEGTGPKPITVDFENENGFKASIDVDDVEDFKSRYSGYKYVNKDDEAFVNSLQSKSISKEERTAELNQTFKSEDLQMNEEDFVIKFEDLLNANGLNVRSLGSGDEIEISTKKTISTARGRENTTGGLIPVSKMTFDLGSGDYSQLNEFISSNADLDYVKNSKLMLPNFKDEYITKMSSTRLKPIKAREQYKINLTKKFEAQEFLDKNPSKTQVLGGGMMISVNTEDPELTDKEKQLYKLWSNGKPIPDLTDEELNLYIDKNYLDNRKRNSSSIFNQFDSKKQRKAAQAIAYDTIENEPDRLLNSKSNVEDYGKKLKDKSEQYKENVNVFNDKFKPFLDEKAGGYVIEKEEDIRLFNDQRKVLMKDLNVILEDEQKLDLLVSNYSSRVDEFSKELPYMPLALENAGKNYNRVEQLLTTAKSYGVGALYGVANIGRLIAGLDRSSISSYALLTEDVNKELSQFQYTPTMSESDTANDYARWFATSSLNAAVSLSIAATGSYAALPAFFLIGAGSSGAETQTSQINATKRIAEKSEQFEKDGFKFNGKELSIEQLDRVEAAYGTEFRKQLVDDFRLINLTERQILSQELLAGSSELIFEKLTTLNFLGGMKSAMGFYAVKDIKSAWRAAGKQTFKGATTEPLGEMATELTVNVGSVKILGEDINVFDNVAEVGWQALIPGLGMGLYSGSKIVDKAFTLENLSQGELNRSIEIKKEIDELLKDYKQGDKLPPKVQELVNELVNENKQLEDRLLTDIREGKLSENDIQEIGEQNRILRKQLLFAEEINNDPSLSNIEKKKLLDEAKSIFDKAHNEREDILSKRRGRKPKTTEQKAFDLQRAVLQYRSNSSYIKTADEKWRKLSNKDKSKEYDRVREEARLKGEKITDAEVEKTAISQFRKKEVSSQYEANKKDGLKFLEDLNSKEGLNLGIDYVELDLKEGEIISQYNVDEYSMKIYGKKFKDLNKKQKGETFAFLTSDKINADGFYENGKIVINKNVSISNGAVGVWQHEILHAIVEKQRKLNPSQAISEGKVLLDFLEKNNPNIYLSIKNRLDGPTYTNKETGVVQYDEVLTMLSDVFQAKDMSENASMIDQLTSFVNKYLPSGKKIPRSDGAKIYDFVKNFSKSSGNTVRSSPNTSSPKSAIDLESSKAKSKELDNRVTPVKLSKSDFPNLLNNTSYKEFQESLKGITLYHGGNITIDELEKSKNDNWATWWYAGSPYGSMQYAGMTSEQNLESDGFDLNYNQETRQPKYKGGKLGPYKKMTTELYKEKYSPRDQMYELEFDNIKDAIIIPDVEVFEDFSYFLYNENIEDFQQTFKKGSKAKPSDLSLYSYEDVVGILDLPAEKAEAILIQYMDYIKKYDEYYTDFFGGNKEGKLDTYNFKNNPVPLTVIGKINSNLIEKTESKQDDFVFIDEVYKEYDKETSSTKFSKTEGIAQTLNELVPENSTKESWIKGGVAEAFLAINDKGILDGSIKNNLNKRGVTITPDLIQKIRDKIIDNLLTAYDPTNAAGLGGYLIGGNKKDKTSFRGKLNFIIGDVIGDEMNQPKTFSTDVEMSGREGQSIATQVPDTSVKETAQERKQKEKKNKEVVSGKKGVQGKTRTPLYKAIRFENDETINSLRDIIENILLKIDISVLENQKNFIAKFREELTGRYYVKDSSGKTKPKVSLKDAWVLVKREAGWPNKAVYESFLIKNKKALLNGFTTTYLSKNFPATIEKFVVEGLDSNGITKGKFTTAWNPKAKTGKKPGNIDFIAPTGDVAQLKGNTSGLQRMKRVEEVESMISDEQWIDHFKVGSKPWPQMKNETIWREIAGEVGYEIFQEEINKFDDLLDQTDSILNDDSLSKLQKKSKIEELESSDEFKIVSKFLYSQDLLQQEQINGVIASINDSLQRGITKFSNTKAPKQFEKVEKIENKEQLYVKRNIGVLMKEQESKWNIFNNVESFGLVLKQVTNYQKIKNKKDKKQFLDGLGKDNEFIRAVILDMELNKLLGERPAGPLAEIMFYQSWLPKNTETFGVSEKQPQGYSPGKGDIEMYYRVNGKKSTFKVEIKSTINGTISSTVIPSKLYDILNEEGIFNGKTIPDNESGNTISFVDFIKSDASEYFKAFAESYNKSASAIKDKDNLEIKGSTFFKDLFKEARTEANNKQVKKGGNITLEEKKNRQPTLKFKLTGKQFEEIFINSYVNSNTKMIIVAELGFKAFALTKDFADATGLPLFGLSTDAGTYPEANVYMTISTGGPKAKLGEFDLTYGSIRGHIVIDAENRKQILINGGGNDLNLSTENKQLQEQIVNKLSGKLSVTHGLPIDPSLVPGVKFSKTDFARKKAIMVVGGIGSGKTTIINKIIDKLNLKRLGFNVVDEDVERSRIQQDKTISEASAYQNARKSVKKRLNDLSDNGDGIIYDNVGGNRNLTTKKVDELKSKGYDVSMILVDTNVEIAKKRDAARDRSMGDFMVEFSNGLVERRKNLYAKDFKGNFALINTDNLDLKQGLPLPFVEKVKSIIKYAVTSEDLSDRFNDIIQETKGVNAGQTFSDSLAQQKGARIGNYKFFVPPSADDFMGLMYAFMGKGSIGELHEDFFEAALNGPYKRGVAGLESAKQKMDDDYKALKKRYPKIAKKLGKKIPGMEYTYDQAIRVYLWKFNSEVFDVDLVKTVGLDQSEINDLFFTVANDVELQGFARGLGLLTNLPKGYIDPSSTWLLDNIASDLNNISEKVSRKKFLSEFILNTEAIFSKENLNKIQAIYGTKFRSALEDSLYAMKNGTSRNFGDNQIANQFADWLNGSVGAIMFINARSASLQLLSTINYINWSDNNMLTAAARFADQKQFWADFQKIINSDKLRQRRKGLSTDVQAAELANSVATSKSQYKSALRYLLRIGFTPTQAADAIAISFGGASFYRNRIKTYEKSFSKEDAERKAWEDFVKITDATQQSADASMVSQQQRNPLTRFILAFQNTAMQYNRVMKKSFLNLINRRGSDRENISKIIYYGAVQNFIFNAVQQAMFAMIWGVDESDEKEEERFWKLGNGMLDTILRGSGWKGAVISNLKNTILRYQKEEAKGNFKADHLVTAIQLFNVAPSVGSKLDKLYGAYKTNWYERDVIKAKGHSFDSPIWMVYGKLASATLNIPADRVVSKINNLVMASKSYTDAWQKVALTAGWSSWSLGLKNIENEGIKSRGAKARKKAGIEKAKITRAKTTAENKKEREAKEQRNSGVQKRQSISRTSTTRRSFDR